MKATHNQLANNSRPSRTAATARSTTSMNQLPAHTATHTRIVTSNKQ